MAELQIKSNDLSVSFAERLSFGNDPTTKNSESNVGLNFGSLKAIVSDNCPNFPDTAPLNLKTLKIIGLTNPLNRTKIIQDANILFMMEPIFIKTVV